MAELACPSAAVLRRREARVARAGEEVREPGRLEARVTMCDVAGATAAAAVAARRSSKLEGLGPSPCLARSWCTVDLACWKALCERASCDAFVWKSNEVGSVETGALSGLVNLRLRTEPARLSVRLRVDMAGLELCRCTEGVEGDEVPKWIMLEERLVLGSRVSSTGTMSPPRIEADEGDGSASKSLK